MAPAKSSRNDASACKVGAKRSCTTMITLNAGAPAKRKIERTSRVERRLGLPHVAGTATSPGLR